MNCLKIADGIFHVGDSSTHNGLDCNPYLLIDGDEGVLFDPGSGLDFEYVFKNVANLIDIEKIKYIVLHHEDPDFCASVPLFENQGLKAQIVTSWRTMTLVQYYGIQSPYFLLEENEHKLVLGSGRTLEFIPTPYLHFAGAFATYDALSQTLFSSDLFGAFSYNRTLYADESYLDKMLSFHEHYMPSNAVLRPVMDVLLGYAIKRILPQHGAIIEENVNFYINALRNLECGLLLAPIKKNLLSSGGFVMIFNDVYKRLEALYDKEDVQSLFQSVPELIFNESSQVSDYFGEPQEIWNKLFDTIKQLKGMLWITVMEPFVRGLAATYSIEIPTVMNASLESLTLENRRLQEMNTALEQTIQSVNERLIKCPITGLFNAVFFNALLVEELEKEDWRDVGAFVCVGIDNFSSYHLKYGIDAVHSALNNMAYLFKERYGQQSIFKLDVADFGIYLKGFERDEIVEMLEIMRVEISKSEIFLGNLTVSMGVAFPKELTLDVASYDLAAKQYIDLSIQRLKKAKMMGKNYVCFEGEDHQELKNQNVVLIVDSDLANLEILKTFVAEMGIQVHTARDGYEALEIAEKVTPKVMVTEINLPKMDGFLLREALISRTKTKDIETIFLSYQKDEESVTRAISIGVSHYMKKPYLLHELLGIIKRNIKGAGE